MQRQHQRQRGEAADQIKRVAPQKYCGRAVEKVFHRLRLHQRQPGIDRAHHRTCRRHNRCRISARPHHVIQIRGIARLLVHRDIDRHRRRGSQVVLGDVAVTPTIWRQASSGASVKRMRLPMGSSPLGKKCFTQARFTITTGGLVALSAAVKARPRSTGIFMTEKYPASTMRATASLLSRE